MTIITQLDELVQKLMASIPPGLSALPADLEKNFRSILQSAFKKMDLVSREEFDAQVGVLRRTREKLEALSQELRELQARDK